MQKKRYKIREKKTPQLHNTLPTELSFDLYKKIHLVYYFCDVSLKIEQFLNLYVNKLFGDSLKMLTKYCVKKSKKKVPISPK